MNVLPTIYFMLVFSLLSLGLTFRIEERARSLVPDRVQNTIVQLAMAQHRHIADPANPNFGAYAGDIATLAATGYLPVWEADPDFIFTDTIPPGLEIQYTAGDNAEAGRVAARLGAIAQVTGNVVAVGFADPTDLALLDEFVERAGDIMSGALEFDAGIGAAINLNDNNLTNALNIFARQINATNEVNTDTVNANTVLVEDGGSGRIEADIVIGATATFNDILVAP